MLRGLSSRRWHTVLDRGLVTLEGADSRKLLQGLTTANVDRLGEDGKPLYTGFLNAQGRVLGAGFLLPARDGGVVLDVDAAVALSLTKHLSRYKLRSKVKITDRSSEFRVCVGGGPDAAAAPAGDALAGDGAAWSDPRLACLGWRALLPRGADGGSLAPGSTAVPAALHGLLQAVLGVEDGVAAMPPGVALPLESNLELLGGVSFSKGCYLGQELTARTHSRGVTRKRLMPMLGAEAAARLRAHPAAMAPPALAGLPATEQAVAAALALDTWSRAIDADEAGAAPQPEQPGPTDDDTDIGALADAGGRSVGKLRRFDARLGLGVALCRLEALNSALSSAGGEEVVPARPSWWPEFVA
eukprot:scaffold9342_cov126-Isochrysis_galbana.AAC.16